MKALAAFERAAARPTTPDGLAAALRVQGKRARRFMAAKSHRRFTRMSGMWAHVNRAGHRDGCSVDKGATRVPSECMSQHDKDAL